jgi:hypothetical protein
MLGLPLVTKLFSGQIDRLAKPHRFCFIFNHFEFFIINQARICWDIAASNSAFNFVAAA